MVNMVYGYVYDQNSNKSINLKSIYKTNYYYFLLNKYLLRNYKIHRTEKKIESNKEKERERNQFVSNVELSNYVIFS